ncbi:hypothetical protein V6N11_079269 [Hibiscus sabdariffa]|uniref:Uncharacterized protein n=1 Tax=Hibiscus sabdariffa TaxID=183260 RepID=A0ABR2RV89_9ROSI
MELRLGQIYSVHSFVESLVLLDKVVNVHSESDVNNPIDSTDSDESSGRESDVALDWILRNHAEACRKEK